MNLKRSLCSLFALFLSFCSSVAMAQMSSCGSWTTGTAMPDPRVSAAGANVNGLFYVIGGSSTGDVSLNPKPEVYDPTTNSWSLKAADPLGRRAESAVGVINGRVYVAEGWLNSDSSSPTNALEIYDPAHDSWSSGASSTTSRGASATAVIGGKLYIAGGATAGNYVVFNNLEIFDPTTNTWSPGR